MNRFLIIFTTVLVSLFTLELLEPVQEGVVVPFTGLIAKISALLVTPFDDSVIAHGKIMQFGPGGFAISIEAGCNGVEATIVLVAAVVAFPASWRARLAAIGLGFITIQIMNIARIISLFYLGRWNMEIFSFFHLYLWPVLIMLDVLLVFVFYLRYLSSSGRPAGND